MALWMSLEVFDGESSAANWAASHGDAVTQAALSGGALDWAWHTHTWGVIFEVSFQDEPAWERFRESTAVRAALDAVPDPVHGLLIYRGRGGSSSRPSPRRPRPFAGAGSASLPLPSDPVEEEHGALRPPPAPRLILL